MKNKLIPLIVIVVAFAGYVLAQTVNFTVQGELEREEIEALKQAYREAGGTNTGLTLKQWASSNNLVEIKVKIDLKYNREGRINSIAQKLREADDDKLFAVEQLLGMR